MKENCFKALRIFTKKEGEGYESKIITRIIDDLPKGDVLIRVKYSSLNYKDALSASGNRGVTQYYPHTPGIDAAGMVVNSKNEKFEPKQNVICTSYDLGMNTDGGFGQYISVPAKWVIPLPKSLSLKESMQLGTAGLTAGIGVHYLEESHLKKTDGRLLVTGATGGVGSLAVAILAKRGFTVTAATGKKEAQTDYLKSIGAHQVIHRDAVIDETERGLLSGKWAGVFDTTGGTILDTAIRQTKHNGVIVCCGNASSHKLNTNVYPFILRGVRLLGIDSGNCSVKLRKRIWYKLADEYKPDHLDRISKPVTLHNLSSEIDRILDGGQVGRKYVQLD